MTEDPCCFDELRSRGIGGSSKENLAVFRCSPFALALHELGYPRRNLHVIFSFSVRWYFIDRLARRTLFS
jgi:hypothetical protein